ncbi:MAG: hypothetical protein H0U40_08150 [Chloroflexia bacterium]|nr:hypothetical protein [Chloroflexia bacterium]
MDLTPLVNPRGKLVRASLLPALATILALVPLVIQSMSEPGSPVVGILVIIGAPAVAFLVNWRWPAATDRDRATYAAIPQVFIPPAMVWLDVWLEVRSGYLLRDSGEEAMAYGIGLTLAAIAGVILMVLVGGAGRLGAWLGTR